MGLHHRGPTTESIVLSQDHFPVSSLLLSERNDWLATIPQTRASPTLVFMDLEASGAPATQTDPVAPQGSSLLLTQRNMRDGSWVPVPPLALISCMTLPMQSLYSPGDSVSTASFIKRSSSHQLKKNFHRRLTMYQTETARDEKARGL